MKREHIALPTLQLAAAAFFLTNCHAIPVNQEAQQDTDIEPRFVIPSWLNIFHHNPPAPPPEVPTPVVPAGEAPPSDPSPIPAPVGVPGVEVGGFGGGVGTGGGGGGGGEGGEAGKSGGG